MDTITISAGMGFSTFTLELRSEKAELHGCSCDRVVSLRTARPFYSGFLYD